ncbi:MAG: methyltransferase domain-containing protein [Reyranella sp.]|nr:methyltransferase domain-containing protein [Reyranella sp.]
MTGGSKPAAELAAEQAAHWNGPGGQGWLRAQARLDHSLVEIGRRVLALANAQSAEKVVDVGCGPGGTTAALAASVGPAGHILGVDISRVLVDAALTRRLSNATFLVADAGTYPFDAASADLVFSRFGVMFFADPVAAFTNLHRALKPSGRLAFVCWRPPQDNPWSLAPVKAAAPFLPPLPRPGPEDPGQFAFGDRARVERILAGAGFAGLAIEPLDVQIWMGKDVADVVANAGRFGPLARSFADADPESVARAKAAIAEALAPHATTEGVSLPGACWLVSAKPG